MTRSSWDDNDGQTLVVFATHLLNDGSINYQVSYNGQTAAMTWNFNSRKYTGIIAGVEYSAGLQGTITATDDGADTVLFNVTDVTGTAPHEYLGHVTQTSRSNFRSPYPWMLHIKFGFH